MHLCIYSFIHQLDFPYEWGGRRLHKIGPEPETDVGAKRRARCPHHPTRRGPRPFPTLHQWDTLAKFVLS